ncbi:LytTR family DNA-binding domain-containing protein [Flagellimonas sp. DF-77]|uniref:LytR/AlgR family response regulator transcription factor n=1 Tax=Flagellimonas algarum TaxID=3230298 RepID=UPI0033982F9E
MTYTCLIVDDEPLAQELILEYVSKIPELQVSATCDNALQASSFLAKNQVDLLFLDINMPVLKGVDFFKNLVHKPQVIFTTAHRDYAVEGFELSALDYLLKPIVFERFFMAVQKFFAHMDRSGLSNETAAAHATVYIRKGHKKIKLETQKLIYIESFKDYIEIHQPSKMIRVKLNIGAFEKELGPDFLRIHRSYIINKHYIQGYSKNEVELNGMELPIGSSYREQVLGYLDRTF